MPRISTFINQDRAKNLYRSKWLNLFLLLSFIVIGNLLIFRNTSESNPLVDFTYQLENSYRILIGQVPYKDFFLVLTPGIYYLEALFLKIFGCSNIGQIVLTILMHSLIVYFTNRILTVIIGNDVVTYLGTGIVALSESVFYPYPIYNSLCFLLALIFGLYFVKNYEKDAPLNSFLIGFLVALPFYAKQNYGMFFAAAFYMFYFFICIRNKKIHNFFVSIVGSLTTVILFCVFLIFNHITFYDFIYQTLIFPGTVKYPLYAIGTSVKGALGEGACITYIYALFLIVFFEKERLNCKLKVLISILLYAGILTVFVRICNIKYSAGTGFWYLIYVGLIFIWFIEACFKRKFFSTLSIGIISFFVMMLGIFTKSASGPTWLFSIVMALIYIHYKKRKFSPIIPLFMSFLLVWNIYYSTKQIQMSWVDEEGALQVEDNVNSKFYKIGIKGPWLKEMENLTQYINNNIGESSFVEVPCEDPIYWATESKPQLNFFQLHPETCPYQEDKIIDLIDENNIEFIIVKRTCQFKNYMITEDEVDLFEEQAFMHGYKLIDKCGIYDILKK